MLRKERDTKADIIVPVNKGIRMAFGDLQKPKFRIKSRFDSTICVMISSFGE